MLVAARASWGIFVLHWKWNHVYFSETTNFHWNKNFMGKCLPDSSQILLSNEKASRWVGNTDLSSLYPRYAHLTLLWRGICWQAQICCPLGCPAQSRQPEPQSCAGRAMGLYRSWHYTAKLSTELPRHGFACEYASLTWSDTSISLRVWCGNLRPSLGFCQT